ncbi:MAG TPA: TIGR01777 family oxidoreductase [Chitinophagaceae bacterium]|nr:TIGR01777 family oxidoreductase [Chitinophagaceae bacterium]
MATVMITGGTGMIGQALTKALLDKQYEIIILTRDPARHKQSTSRLRYVNWDINKQHIDPAAITQADYIVHLAGANVADKRWTKKRKKEILDSRVKSGALLVKALHENVNTIKAVVSASGIGWYGPDSGQRKTGFDEDEPAFSDYLGTTCQQWEQSIEPVKQLGKRLVKFRTGVVLSREDGAFPEFTWPLRFGIAPILSTGKQIISWIHIDDLVRLYVTAIEDEKLAGSYNAVAPFPVSNKELVMTLGKLIRGRFFIPIHIPSLFLKLYLGEMSIEVLKSAMVSSGKIQEQGFIFQYPRIHAALENLVGE